MEHCSPREGSNIDVTAGSSWNKRLPETMFSLLSVLFLSWKIKSETFLNSSRNKLKIREGHFENVVRGIEKNSRIYQILRVSEPCESRESCEPFFLRLVCEIVDHFTNKKFKFS